MQAQRCSCGSGSGASAAACVDALPSTAAHPESSTRTPGTSGRHDVRAIDRHGATSDTGRRLQQGSTSPTGPVGVPQDPPIIPHSLLRFAPSSDWPDPRARRQSE